MQRTSSPPELGNFAPANQPCRPRPSHTDCASRVERPTQGADAPIQQRMHTAASHGAIQGDPPCYSQPRETTAPESILLQQICDGTRPLV